MEAYLGHQAGSERTEVKEKAKKRRKSGYQRTYTGLENRPSCPLRVKQNGFKFHI